MGLLSRIRNSRLQVAGIVAAVAILIASGQTAKIGKQSHSAHGKLVILMTTGMEDLRELNLCLGDTNAVKASGHLEDVIWIAQGRGVDSLADASGRTPEIVQMVRKMRASGVHMIVSGPALAQYGFAAASLDPKPDEIVPDAAARMAELISQGYQVIRY